MNHIQAQFLLKAYSFQMDKNTNWTYIWKFYQILMNNLAETDLMLNKIAFSITKILKKWVASNHVENIWDGYQEANLGYHKKGKYAKPGNIPLGDHFGSVGDSTIVGSPPATHIRLDSSLWINMKQTISIGRPILTIKVNYIVKSKPVKGNISNNVKNSNQYPINK